MEKTDAGWCLMRIALAGNPNSGKTTVFNKLTGSNAYVGNWPGVTVEKREGRLRGHENIIVTDLPGMYSIHPCTPEETAGRDYLLYGNPDVIINVVDASNIERSLYLTTQLLDLGIPVIVALNMMDIAKKRGDSIDIRGMSALLGCAVCPMNANRGAGIYEAAEMAVRAVTAVTGGKKARRMPGCSEDEIAGRYNYIEGLVRSCIRRGNSVGDTSDMIDKIATNRWLALPVFGAVMFFVYSTVAVLGAPATQYIRRVIFAEKILPTAEHILEWAGASEVVSGLVTRGIIGGVGAVLSFVPQIAVLFFMLSFLEDCGYMARIAFMMDRIFRKFGLSGKSVVPLLVSCGCAVPGIMAARTIENARERRITVITASFVPCSAKLPVIALVFGAVFGGEKAGWAALIFYFAGIVAVAISGIILKNTSLLGGVGEPFIMELPTYRFPGVKGLAHTVWERVKAFIIKAGTVIFLASAVLWLLGNFGMKNGSLCFLNGREIELSILAMAGRCGAWLFRPVGFGNWEAVVATGAGLIAKENIVATLGIFLEGTADTGGGLRGIFGSSSGLLAFLIFNLLCAPCVAAIGAIRREMGSAKWTAFAVGYQCAFAYAAALVLYQTWEFAKTGRITAGLIAAITVVIAAFRSNFISILFSSANPSDA